MVELEDKLGDMEEKIPDSYIQRLAILLIEKRELTECIHALLMGLGPLTLVEFVVIIVTFPKKGTIHSINGILKRPPLMTMSLLLN